MSGNVIVMQDFNTNILSLQLFLSLVIITIKQTFIKYLFKNIYMYIFFLKKCLSSTDYELIGFSFP